MSTMARMSRTIAAAALLVILVAACWLAVASPGMPGVEPATARSVVFSADRAMEHVRTLAREPRPVGVSAHDAAGSYIVARLRDLGLEPRVEETVAISQPSWGHDAGRVRNVMARLPGLDTESDAPAVLLMAHYDSAPSGPGASDDAVGAAVLLETLRALLAGEIPRHDVIALFTDAEEAGLLGAEGFVADDPWFDRVGVVLNFEARGTRGPALMFETGADNRWLIERFAEAAPHPVAASYSYEVYRRLPNDTDYSVFRRAGVPGLNFAHIHGAVGYHTAQDSVERLDPASLQHHGETALALAKALGDADLPAPGSGGDAVYFNPLGSAFVHFPASWVPALAVILALAALAILVLALVKRRLGAGGLVAGLLAWLAIVAVVVGLGMAAVGLLFPIFYDFRIWGDGSSVAWTLFGWLLLALGIAALLYLVLRRWVSAAGMTGGGLLLWTLAGVAVSLIAPGASYLFLVPLAFQVVAAGWLFLGDRTPAGADPARPDPGISIVLLALLALAAVAAALVWSSTLGLIAVGLQFGAVVALAALAALLEALLAPQVEVLVDGLPGPRWLLPALLVVAGGALVLAVHASAGFDADSPRPTSLLYALDADRGEARWASFDLRSSPWTESVLPADAERAPLPGFLGRDVEVAQAEAPVVDLPAPTIEVSGGEGGEYRARVVPPSGAARLRLIVTPASAVRAATVDGRELTGLDPAQDQLAVLYYAPSPEGVELDLKVDLDRDGGAPAPELAAVAMWLRLPGEEQGGPPPRGPETMPTARTFDTDVTMVRTAVRLDEAVAPVEDGAEGGTADGGSTPEANPVE